MHIERAAKRIIKKYQTRDPFELAKCLGIIIILEELDLSVEGYFQYFQRNKLIHVNQSISEDRKRIVIAHEIGHAILHTKSNSIALQNSTFFVEQKYENEADLFAAELLLPDRLDEKYPEYFTMDQIANSENVPVEFVYLKLFGINQN